MAHGDVHATLCYTGKPACHRKGDGAVTSLGGSYAIATLPIHRIVVLGAIGLLATCGLNGVAADLHGVLA